ncbi:MAG: beta-galactosidase [Pseudomonadota bacterium]|nr:beta-galactosidase [Pseudomonadota bacterium]
MLAPLRLLVAGLLLVSGPAAAAAPATAAPPPTPASRGAYTQVDLAPLRNHDLFDGTAAPLFRLKATVPWAPPVPLAFDPKAAPDVVLLKSADSPQAPAEVEIPVGRAARTIYVLAAGQGPLGVRDIAADGEIRYADGRTQPLKWMVGEQIWPAWAGATGRNADPLAIGWNPSGDLLTASLLTVDASWPDAPIASITVKSRVGPLSFAILAVTTADAPPVTVVPQADREPFEGYDFRVPALLDAPLPIDPALAVTGPAARPIVVKDGHLAYAQAGSEAGQRVGQERARFWGINLVGLGALPDLDVADAYAASLARAGFNLVRPHHMDADAEGTLVNPRRGEPGEPLALPEALDRMDRFHAALKAAGVYVYLETWTLRSFLPEEGVPSPRGLAVGNKYAPFFWPEYAEAKKAWVRALYDRVNPYTGLRYADDPAVALFEIANEDSLLVAWSGGALERLPGDHRRRLDERWNAWLRTRYTTDTALNTAWKGPVRAGLQLGETLSLDSVAREPSTRGRTELFPPARAADLARFYGELEAAHHADMARFLKEELGFRAPIVCNTSFGVPLAEAQLAACDVVDLHVYWDPIAEQNVYFDQAMIERPLHGRVLEKLAWCQDGRPCTMSELNHSWPNRYAHEAPLVWSSLAARQDLDAVVWFAYAHGAFDPAPDGPAGALDLAGRFSSWVQMPTASALFRSGAVAPPARRFVRWWSPDGLLRDLAEPSSLWIDAQVSWQSVLDNVLRTSFAALPPTLTPAPAPGSAPVRWWPEAGRWIVDTPAYQAIVGRTINPVLTPGPDGKPPAADPASLRVVLSSFASVSLASLDGAPLAAASPTDGPSTRRALLTLAGRTERDGTLRSTGGPGTLVYGKGPARLERLDGFVDVRWTGRPEAWILDPTGAPVERVSLQRLGGGWWRLAIRGLSSPWVELRSR